MPQKLASSLIDDVRTEAQLANWIANRAPRTGTVTVPRRIVARVLHKKPDRFYDVLQAWCAPRRIRFQMRHDAIDFTPVVRDGRPEGSR